MKTKKTSKLLFLFLVISLYGQNLCSQINFSDSVLKQKLLTANTSTNQIAFDINDNPIAVDINPTDGTISSLEAAAVYKLNLRYSYGSRISSIEGLQYFTNLKSLDLYNNNISNPNQLYALSATLETLDISFNRYLENQSLQFSGTNLNNLVSLKAFAIGLSTINVAGLSNLQELNLSNNWLTSLNLSGCSSLITVNASSNRNPNLPNSGITTLTYNVGDLLNVTTLNLSTNRFSALQLADFPNLQILYVYENDLTTLDVSSLYQLVELSCNNNHIGSINFGTINQLQYLSCSYNNLHNLDVSNQTSLLSLSCRKNYLTNLDISSLSNLTSLICSNNLLTTLDASTNSELSVLICSDNNLTSMILKNNGPFLNGESFGFFNNDNLTYICEDAGQISYINTYLAQYGYTGVTVDSNCGIDPPCDLVAIPDPNFEQALLDQNIDTDGLLNGTICRVDAEAQYDLLDVVDKNINDLTGIEAFINIKRLFCSHNNLTTLNLTSNILLTNLFCSFNNLTSLDLTANTLIERVSASHNNIAYANISNNPYLNFLDLAENSISTIDLSNNLLLNNLSLSLNQLYNVDVTNNTALKRFHVSGNHLTSLNVSNNLQLNELSIGSNQISAINLSQNISLTTLACQNNQLTSLNLNTNTVLKNLFCNGNNLTSLNLSTNIMLQLVYCYVNKLKNLNIRNGNNNPTLKYVRTENNPNLTCIMVDNTAYANAQPTSNWIKDVTASYNTYCPSVPIAPGPIVLHYCDLYKSKFTMSWDAWQDVEGYEVEVTSSLYKGIDTYRLHADQTSLTIKAFGEMSWRIRPVLKGDGIWSDWTYKCKGFALVDDIFLQKKTSTGTINTEINIYPNPVKKGGILTVNSIEPIQSLTVYNVYGQTVFSAKAGIKEINTGGFKPGMYLIKIKTADKMSTKKIMIE